VASVPASSAAKKIGLERTHLHRKLKTLGVDPKASKASHFMPTPAALFAALIFGIIGLAAFRYGKKSSQWQPMVLGMALLAYPYFFSDVRLLYGVGVALTVALFVFKD
jgi:hypothetical protein